MQKKYLLGEERIPRRWYNIAPDFPSRPRRRCTPAPASRPDPTTWRRSSPWA